MRAFHNDPAIKEKYLARVRAHRLADEIVHGFYWEHGKGCAVGCTVHSGEHSAYETELGIPCPLARLEDGIFEGMKNGDSLLWPEHFLDSIHVGSDLCLITGLFLHWLLVDPKDGVIRFAKSARSRTAIETVAALYVRQNDGEVIASEEWRAAAEAAEAAYAVEAAYAAEAAAYAAVAAEAAAADDAAAAADAAEAAAEAAAYAAANADTAAWKSAKTKARKRQSEKLLDLLMECK